MHALEFPAKTTGRKKAMKNKKKEPEITEFEETPIEIQSSELYEDAEVENVHDQNKQTS